MKKIFLICLLFLVNVFSFTFAVSNDVKKTLGDVATNRAGSIDVGTTSGRGVRDFIVNIGTKILIPIIVVIGIMVAFIGFYKLFFTDKEDERKKGLNFFIWGTLGVILMTSARFITYSLVGSSGGIGIIGSNTSFDPATIANRLYSGVFHKFFILLMYIIIIILFINLLVNVIKFMSSPAKDDVNKHMTTILVWNTFGIIIIIFAKSIVEMFYGMTSGGAVNLGQQAPILKSKNIGWLYTVLNYFLGFVAFAITIFIIYQSYLLIMDPDDDKTYKSLKRYFIYAILGVFLIGAVYLIANFFIIK